LGRKYKWRAPKAAPGVYFYSITATGFDGSVYEIEGAFHLMRE